MAKEAVGEGGGDRDRCVCGVDLQLNSLKRSMSVTVYFGGCGFYIIG